MYINALEDESYGNFLVISRDSKKFNVQAHSAERQRTPQANAQSKFGFVEKNHCSTGGTPPQTEWFWRVLGNVRIDIDLGTTSG